MMFCNLLTVLPFVAGILGKPLTRRADNSDFTVYAYGPDGLGGYPVISINNAAYIATKSKVYSNNTVHSVTFDAPDTRGNFTATINGGDGLFYIPSSSGAVGFTNTTTSSQITTGFGFYGHVIYVYIDSTMITQWYAVPTSDSGLYQLSWNVSSTSGAIPIALRNIAPS